MKGGKVNLLEGLTKTTLDNGLTLLVKEDHRLPIATVMVWYKVGSVNESEGNTGLSHFLEHMMFKGTTKYRKGEVDLITFRNGGGNNAFTGEDYTAYFFNFGAGKWSEALEIEASRMVNCGMALQDSFCLHCLKENCGNPTPECTSAQKEFESERRVVLEELRRQLDHPWGLLTQEVDKTVFTKHPYHHPVIGWQKDVEAMTRGEMASYYRRFYKPNNAILVVVGDVKAEEVQRKVKELFGSIPRGEVAAAPSVQEPPQKEERRVDIKTEHNVSRLRLAFRTEKIGAPSDYSLDILQTALAEGKNSRLRKRLVEEEQLVADLDAENDARKYDGVFYISAELVPGASLEEVEQVICEELEAIQKGTSNVREIEQAKNRILEQLMVDVSSEHVMKALDKVLSPLVSAKAISAKALERIKRRIREQRTENKEQVKRAIERELGMLKVVPLSATELQRAKNRIFASFLFSKENVYGVANVLGYFETKVGLNYLKDYLANIDAVTLRNLQETASKFFRKENRTVSFARAKVGATTNGGKGGSETPHRKGKTPNYRNGFNALTIPSCTLRGREEARMQSGGLPPIKLGEQWEVRLTNGLTILVVKRPELPIVTFKAFVNAGPVYEPAEKAGLANMMGRLLSEGTYDPINKVKRTYAKIADDIEFVGGRLSTSAIGVDLQVLSKDKNMALDLLRDMLRYPSFPNASSKEDFPDNPDEGNRVEQVRRLVLDEIISIEDSPAQVAQKLFYETVYGKHPLGRPAIGYKKTVESITRGDLVEYHKKFYRPDNTILVVVGDVNPKIIGDIRARFIDWVSEGELAFPEVPKPQPLNKPIWVYFPKESEQMNIYIGLLGIDRNNPDYHALLVMDYILGRGPGFTDRLSKILRDKEGLAYTVYGSITANAGVYPGTFTVYIGTGPDSKEKAVGGIFREIDRFVSDGVTEEEIRDAKDYLTRSFVFNFESNSAIADYLIQAKRFNFPDDYLKKYPRLIEGVTRDELVHVARKYLGDTFSHQPYVGVIVGPVNEKGEVIKKRE